MKKVLALVLAIAMICCAASADILIGQVDYAAHGTKCFAVITAVVDGETIVAAKIDEFQMMNAPAVGVPNSEAMFAAEAAEGKVLGSKRVNNGMYSTNMKNSAGSTQPLGVSYDAIEAFVAGKTISELEAFVAGKEKTEVVDAVTGTTLADTMGYIEGIIAAAKAASLKTGYYTLYNKTGEKATVAMIVDGAPVATAALEPDAAQVLTVTAPEGTVITVSFVTESGRNETFDRLHIETAPVTLLAADAMTGATPISFFAPAAE